MISGGFPQPMPGVSEEDTQPYAYQPPVPTLDLLTVDVPRASDFGRIAERLARNPDADFWLPEAPPIPMRIKLARTLRRLANYLERGGK